MKIKRTYHLGDRIEDIAVIVCDDRDDQMKIEFVDPDSGRRIIDWYPRPGTGRLSGRQYDEERGS